ncbi:hypothetical protein ACHAXR_005971 [Thalassiosira sp. AJA248-18]
MATRIYLLLSIIASSVYRSIICLAAPAQSVPLAPLSSSNHDRRHILDDPSRRSTPTDIWNDFLRNGREARRPREPVLVDYKGQRECYDDNIFVGHCSLNVVLSLILTISNTDPFERHRGESSDERKAQSIPATTYNDSMLYEPMRLQFDTHLLDALSTKYPSHVAYVRNNLLPTLSSFWSKALSVIPAAKIEVPLAGGCSQFQKQLSGFDLDDFLQYETSLNRTFSNIGNEGIVEMDSDGNSLVYNDKDLVVIVLPVEGTALCPESQNLDSETATLAFATNCQTDQLDRPTVGLTGICFGPLDIEADNSTKTYERQMMTIAHEFTHVLGMNSDDFPFFYSHATGKPRTPRDDWNQPPQKQALCVDGSTRQNVLMPSEDTVLPVMTTNGYIAYEVVTETVRNVVRNQFDCQSAAGGRLENQPTADTDCFGSHWDHRLFNNDYMAAVYTGSTQYITALTLALLEDSGWYLSNYEMATNSPFGLGAGCAFLEEKCIQNSTLPKWAEGTFCNDSASIGCTPDKHLVAYCDISQWGGNLPSGYQYFDDPSTGGGLQQRDFCPAYSTIFRFESGEDILVLDCTDPELNGAWVNMAGEVYGEDSRCIEHASGYRPLCLEIKCIEDGEDAGKVIVVGDGDSLTCSYAGEVLQFPSGTEVICPSFEQTCPESICPANCAGRGICDYSLSPAQCKCFDQTDTSPFCSASPLSFPPTVSPVPTQGGSPSVAPTPSPMTSSSPPTGNVSASPTKNVTADDISASPSKAVVTGSTTVAPSSGSSTGVPTVKPTAVAEDEPVPDSTNAPSSGGMVFQPGVAGSLFVGALWLFALGCSSF